MPAKLIIESEVDKTRKEMIFDKPQITIGRKAGNDLHYNRPEISGNHAAFLKEGNQFFITDLGSTNGTLLNGAPILAKEKYPLRDKDVVLIAPYSFTFSEGKDVSATMMEDSGMNLERLRGSGTKYEPVNKIGTGTAEHSVPDALLQAVEAAGGTDPDLEKSTRANAPVEAPPPPPPPPPPPAPAPKPAAPPRPAAPAAPAAVSELPPAEVLATKEPSALSDYIWLGIGAIFLLAAIGLILLLFVF